MLSYVIDSNEERHVATYDIVGAYLYADRDKMVDVLVAANKSKYKKHVYITKKGGGNIIHGTWKSTI